MEDTLPGPRAGGLERSCGREPPQRGSRASRPADWLRSRPLGDGVHALQAWFGGHGYDPHRHDTYAIGVTDAGVQAFDYRGASRVSTPGEVVVLHPDERHDGRAGTADGFGYRIVYVAPGRVLDAARAILGRPCALPFARAVVSADRRLAAAVTDAFSDGADPLAADDLVLRLTEALLDADPSSGHPATPARLDARAMARARQLLDAETGRVVASAELERATDLSRYEVARQFRAAYGTSPYRYSVLRRLDRARRELTDRPLAEVALDAGFADQAHFTRAFKAAVGVSPGRYRALEAGAAAGRR